MQKLFSELFRVGRGFSFGGVCRNWSLSLLGGVLSISSAAVLFSGCASLAVRPDFEATVQRANSQVFPAVVYIHAVAADLESGKEQGNVIRGSGVIISPSGEVLTNFHVADKASNIRCLLNNSDAYEAEIIGYDKDVDLALLQLKLPPDAAPLPYAELEAEPVREGQFVMAMGAPWGMNRSVSIGIISCSSRYLPGESEYSLWYQTDAAISPGNSGGPLVNTHGRIVGINTLGMNYGGDMGFAIPAGTIADVVPRLREYKAANWAWTGLELQPLHDFDLDINFDFANGVIVSGTAEGSPARLAGVLPKDRIVAMNNVPITVMNAEAMPDFRRKLGLLPFDVPVKLTIMRGDEEFSIDVTPQAKGVVEGENLILKRWGITVKAINRFDNPDLFHYRNNGVYVYGIDYSGNAGRSRLRTEDIITHINGKEINDLAAMQTAYDEAVANVANRSKAVFGVLRNGAARQLVIEFSRENEK